MSKKKLYISLAIVLILMCAFVGADYFAIFGTRQVPKSDFINLDFKVVDEKNGSPVVNVHVRCFQLHNNNACTQRESHRAGYVRVGIPVVKIFDKTLLFTKGYTLQKTNDTKVHIMFIHNDYANPVETFEIPNLPEIKDKVFTVAMPESMFKK